MVNSPLPAAIERLKSGNLLQSNIELILLHDKKLAGERLSEERRKKFIDRLRWWGETLNKDFKAADQTDLENAYQTLKTGALKAGTVNLYLSMLKQFYKHIEGDDDEYPKKVRKLKQLDYQPEMISEGETSIQIYSPDEISRMIHLARTPREKCLIALSYDCGGRLDEIRSLKMGHVKNDPPFYKIYLHGNKTHKSSIVGPRWVSVYFAVPYINDYLKSHPYTLKDTTEPFWINSGKYGGKKDAQLSQSGFKTLFDRIKEKAEIKGKRFHDLRHTKYTHLLRLRMHEPKAKKFMGWSANSKQPARYGHLVSEDIDEELSSMYGLQFTRKAHDDIPIPVKCAICSEINEAGADICKKCNNPLTAKAITSATTREKYWKQKYDKGMADLAARLKKLESEKKGMAGKAADRTVDEAKTEAEAGA